MVEQQGGTIANQTGQNLEAFIENALKYHGYQFVDKDKFKPSIYLEQPIYTKQAFICKSIYDTNVYCDFLIYHPEKFPDCLIIESKWQQIGGSVDEKYPYLIINIQTRYPHRTVLVLDGGGYKKGAEEWIRSEVGNNLIAVYSMAEFQTWVNKGGL